MRIKSIKKGIYAKPPKWVPNLLSNQSKIREFEYWLGMFNPEIKSRFLRILKDPKIRAMMEQKDVEEVMEKIKDFSGKLKQAPRTGELILWCELFGWEVTKEEQNKIAERLEAVWRTKSKKIQEFIFNLFDAVENINWGMLNTETKQEIIMWISQITQNENTKNAKESLGYLYKITKTREWKELGECRAKALEMFRFINSPIDKSRNRRFIEDVFKVVRRENWKQIKFPNTVYMFGLIWGSGNIEEATKFIELILKLTKHKNWKKLDEDEKERIITFAGNLVMNYSIETSEDCSEFLLNIMGNKNWKKLSKHSKVKAVMVFEYLAIRKSISKAKNYLNAILKILENGIILNYLPQRITEEKIDDFEIDKLLIKVVREYKQTTKPYTMEELEIGKLKNIQEIIRDLAMIDPEGFFENCTYIFWQIPEEEFKTLCTELAKENPELVENVGNRLDLIFWHPEEDD